MKYKSILLTRPHGGVLPRSKHRQTTGTIW